jgi:hypothetical protein
MITTDPPRRSRNLTRLFTATAALEGAYAAAALLTPPSLVQNLTGWVLNADGQWLAKLLGAALGFQGLIAWTFRNTASRNLALIFAGYQLLAATIDWVMWIVLANQGIFSTPLAQVTVIAAILSHYVLGFLLLAAALAQGDGTQTSEDRR